jgi:hypothetical protein
MFTAIGIIASCLTLAGLFLIGAKWRLGFALLAIANVGWVIDSVASGRMDLLSLNVAMAAINIRSFAAWSIDV